VHLSTVHRLHLSTIQPLSQVRSHLSSSLSDFDANMHDPCTHLPRLLSSQKLLSLREIYIYLLKSFKTCSSTYFCKSSLGHPNIVFMIIKDNLRPRSSPIQQQPERQSPCLVRLPVQCHPCLIRHKSSSRPRDSIPDKSPTSDDFVLKVTTMRFFHNSGIIISCLVEFQNPNYWTGMTTIS
jgi:hypothetical protein